MTVSIALLAGLLAAGQLAAPDSLVLPMMADTLFETELVIFPPPGAQPPISYQVDWGNGDTDEWTQPVGSMTDISRFHRYRSFGTFEVSVRVRDSLGRTSDWGKPLAIQVGEPAPKWYYSTKEPVMASITLDRHGNLYAGGEGGTFFSLKSSGHLRWVFKTGGAIYGAAAVQADLVFFCSLDSVLYCLDTTGRKRWSCHLGDELYCPPALAADGTVYVGTDDGRLVAVSKAGKVLWEYATSDQVSSGPTVSAGGLVYVTSDSVYCLDGKGKRRWAWGSPTGAYFFASATPDAGGQVYVGDDEGVLHCIGPDGTQLWSTASPDGKDIRPEVTFAAGGTIYFGTDGRHFIGLTPGDRPAVLHEAVDILCSAAALSDKGTAYFLPDDGRLRALAPSGRPLWHFDLTGSGKEVYYSSAPTIGPDGMVYVGSWDGRICAFRGDGPPARSAWPQHRHDAQHTGRLGQ